MGTFAISVFVLIQRCSTCFKFPAIWGLWCHYLSCKALCQRRYKIDTFIGLVGEHLTFDQSVIQVGWRQLKEEEAHLSQRRSRAESILPCHKWKNGQLLCTVAVSWIQATTMCFLPQLRTVVWRWDLQYVTQARVPGQATGPCGFTAWQMTYSRHSKCHAVRVLPWLTRPPGAAVCSQALRWCCS